MRKYLLPQGKNCYKANLHSHSTVSDGGWTPQEMKEEYMKRGYSILAITDHNIMADHSYLSDENFLALMGWELDQTEAKPWAEDPKTCHMCFIALKPDAYQHFVRRYEIPERWMERSRDIIRIHPDTPDSKTLHSPEHISAIMQAGREAGFFVTYNHPCWSLETWEDYSGYRGMHAMEICCYGSYRVGYEDYCPAIYDDILRSGNRIFCTGTDDAHSAESAFGAYTVIYADDLKYESVADALVRGDFYASMGPEIHELYVEDGEVHIKCSPARRIAFHTGARLTCGKVAEGDELLTEAVFPLYPRDRDPGYFRLSVTDEKGRHANTNAYFTDSL